MKVLYMATAGPADPVRASLPVHLAVNGSLEIGHAVVLLLAGDAAELVREDARNAVEGLGFSPMRDLVAKAVRHGVPIHV